MENYENNSNKYLRKIIYLIEKKSKISTENNLLNEENK